MAALDFDSFDYYRTANLGQVYDAVDNGGDYTAAGSAQIALGVGRCNTNCLKVTSSPARSGVIRGVAATSGTAIIQFGVNHNPAGSTAPVLFDILHGTIPIFRLIRGLDGSLVGLRNPDAAFPPTSFVSYGGLVPANQWRGLGLKIVLAASPAGSVTIMVDGVIVQTITGIGTSDDGSAWSGVHLGGRQFTTTVYYDDFYVGDGSGAAPWNDLLGDIHIQRLREVGPGSYAQFSLTGAATNWQAEDDADSPNVASYVDGNAVGLKDSYQFEDLAVVAGNQIFGVKISALCYKDLAGGRTLEFMKEVGGTVHLEGTALGIPTGANSYSYIKRVMMLDPETGAQWANEAAVNGSDGNFFGMELVS